MNGAFYLASWGFYLTIPLTVVHGAVSEQGVIRAPFIETGSCAPQNVQCGLVLRPRMGYKPGLDHIDVTD